MVAAYLITAYKYPHQLARLVNRIKLEAPRSRVWVHVDANVDILPFVKECAGSAEFISERRRVAWGTFSMVQATMDLASSALNEQFSHAVLLSEQCYPIRSIQSLERFLSARPDVDFIDVRDLRKDWPDAAMRYERYRLPRLTRHAPRAARVLERSTRRAGLRRQPPANLTVHGGSTWWTLSRSTLDYVTEVHRTNRRLRRFFVPTFIPEEMYVHTIVANRPGASIGPTLTYARFDRSFSVKHPIVWTTRDIEELESSGSFFARKFDETIDGTVMTYFDKNHST